MSIPIHQVDAFTDRPFGGNPAAVCFPPADASEDWMQAVAAEMNLSETAFVVPLDDGFALRWFTPTVEVELCGHATLASAHVLWATGRLDRDAAVRFHTRKSGVLTCRWVDGEIVGCRTGDPEVQPHGSRNFVLIKHKLLAKGPWENQEFYSLYMHLDEEKAADDAKVRWRRELYFRSKRHVVASVTCPRLAQKTFGTDKRLLCQEGLAPGESAEVVDNAVAAKTLDDRAPDSSDVVRLPGTDPTYIPTKWENQELAKIAGAVAGLTAKLTAGAVVGLKEPIPVHVGELLGQVAKAPTDDSLKGGGAFLHFETFAAASLPVGPQGFVAVSGPTDPKKAADRKEAVDALVKAQALPQPTDGVLLESELGSIIGKAPYGPLLRSTTLSAASHWAVDWDAALQQATCFGFLADTDRKALATAFNTYSWWADVKSQQGAIPAPETIYHYHPIALILQIAYA